MKQRVEWIDLVKASSVLLVVFMHATNVMVDLAGPGGVGHVLQTVNIVVEPLRMPAFFLVSGMLAAAAIHRPWRATTIRTLGMAYLFTIWTLLFMGVQALWGADVGNPIRSLLLASSGYWYLYAVGLFFVIAKLLRNQPGWLVVLIAVVPNLLRPVVDQWVAAVVPGALYTSIAMNLCFFLAGAYFMPVIARWTERATWRHTVLLGAVAVPFGLWWMTSSSLIGASYLPVSLLLLAFGLGLAVQVTRHGAPAWTSHLGARTLPIYVWQWPVIFIVGLAVPGQALEHPLAQLAFPFAVTAMIAVSALRLYRIPSLTPAFQAPDWVVGARPTTRADLDGGHSQSHVRVPVA